MKTFRIRNSRDADAFASGRHGSIAVVEDYTGQKEDFETAFDSKVEDIRSEIESQIQDALGICEV